VTVLTGGMEALLLVMVVVSPWGYGSNPPYFRYYLALGVLGLAALWAARILVEWRFTWAPCPVSVCLAGLFLLGIGQLLPLPRPLLDCVSPAAAAYYQELLPAVAEEVSAAAARDQLPLVAGSSLSLYPAATRQGLFELLAVFLIFVVVRTNLASVAVLRRLSMVAVVNGVLLALFGLIQGFTSRHNIIFWKYPTLGSVFGPFICRNHFAFYMNLCVGLGVGWLLASTRQRQHSRPSDWEATEERWYLAAVRYFNHPLSLYLIAALALMISSVAFCLSRGGVLALLGSGLVTLLIRLSLSRRSLQLGQVLLLGSLVLGLLAWFGLEAVQQRLATLWNVETVQEGRWSEWVMVWPLAWKFWLCGTGLGTFQYVEPLMRLPTEKTDLIWDHAHNEYLEALIEGGLVRLALSLVAIGLVYRLGYRALRRYRGRSAAPLILGALFAFTSVVIHSVVDFGLHIPAIALLTTMLAALLAGLGTIRPHSRQAAAGEPPPDDAQAATVSLPLFGGGPLVGAGAVLTLGLMLVGESGRVEQAERFHLAAARLAGASDWVDRERQIAYLEEAVRLTPENARFHDELAQVQLDWFEEEQSQHAALLGRLNITQLVGWSAPGGTAPGGGTGGLLSVASAWRAVAVAQQQTALNPEFRSAQGRLRASLKHFLAARDLCPLLARPQLQLGGYGATLQRADPASVYYRRTAVLRPFDGSVWYLAGGQELQEGQAERAWYAWRRSLECSDAHLRDILRQSWAVLTPTEIRDQIIPADPALLLATASELERSGVELEKRQPFLEAGLALLTRQGGGLLGSDYYTQASLRQALGQLDEAATAYRLALRQEPGRLDWRLELAAVLHQQRRFAEARTELLNILAAQPGHAPAKKLLQAVSRELAEDALTNPAK